MSTTPHTDHDQAPRSSRTDTRIAGSAEIGEEVSIGSFAVIEADVRIGHGCAIGHHVVIREGTEIGDHVRIDDHAVLGKQPMRSARSAVTHEEDQPALTVGEGAIIGTGAILYAGARIDREVMVADEATIREDVVVGEKTIIGRGVAVENECRIGARCKIETNAYLSAYSRVGDDAFIAPCVATSNDSYLGRTEKRFDEYDGVTVERGGRIGVGAVILPGRTVEADAVVAGGAVLTRDAEARRIWAGVPARELREVSEDQLLENQ